LQGSSSSGVVERKGRDRSGALSSFGAVPRNVRSDVVTFLAYLARRSPRTLRWDPAGRRSDGTPATVLIVRDRIPRPPFRAGAAQFEITSAAHRIRASRFGGEVARVINTTGAKAHGRTLTCIDANAEPIAALAYHRADDSPLLVTAIAVVSSEAGGAAIVPLSRAMAGVLLCYLAAAAQVAGLPPRLGFAPSDRALADELGFRAVRPPRAFAAAGARYLEWEPPDRLSRLVPPRGLLGAG
jgi:hypothetical protein